MNVPARTRQLPSLSVPCAGALLLVALSGCQKSEEHPPFVAACEDCSSLPGIVVASGSVAGASNSTSDAGPSTLTGQVLLLTDDSFVNATLFTGRATVRAQGASGAPVSAEWDGADPYQLSNVAPLTTNWLSVTPETLGADVLPTYQPVHSNAVSKVDVSVISVGALDTVFNAISSLREPNSGQLVLFLQSAGKGGALAGLNVTVGGSAIAAYRSGNTWQPDSGKSVTDASGLVVFGNIDAGGTSKTQIVTVTRAATASNPATNGGQFAVEIVAGAATIVNAAVQL